MTKLILGCIFALGCSAFAADESADSGSAPAAKTKHHHKVTKKEKKNADGSTETTTTDDKMKAEGHHE